MTFEEQVVQELKLLKMNATAYQVVKALDLGKSTVYRVFKDLQVNDFQFETIAKLVDYSRKLEGERKEQRDGTDVMFQYRNERIVLAQQITAQPLLWHNEVTCEMVEKPSVIEDYLAQLDLDTRGLEYSIYPFLPSHNNDVIKKGVDYIVDLSTHFNLVENAMDIGIEVNALVPDLDGFKREVVMQDTVVTVSLGKLNIEQHKEDLLHLSSLFRQYLAIHLTEKSGNVVGYSYFVTQENDYKVARKGVKKVVPTATPKMEYTGTLYTDTQSVFYELEELLKGKPYQVSTNYAYERLNGFEMEYTEVQPIIEVQRIDGTLMVFLKHYNSDGIVLSTQLLINTPCHKEIEQYRDDVYVAGMLKDFVTRTKENYEEVSEYMEDLIIQPLQVKFYI